MRPSGVLSAGMTPSIPASAGDAMMEAANPVAFLAAVNAHFSFSAVIRILPAHMENISANVSSIITPFSRMYPSDVFFLTFNSVAMVFSS